MKKALILIVVLAASITTFAQKLGHIDTAELMEVFPGMDDAQAEIDSIRAEHQMVLDELRADYDEKYTKLMNNPPTTETVQNMKVQELGQIEQNIQQYAQMAEQDIYDAQDKLLNPLYEEARNVIEKVGAANGYTYIFDSSVGVILYEGGDDIMSLVKAELGIAE